MLQLIGNYHYFDLLQPGKMDLGNGLFLFQSKLGWIFDGKVTANTEGVASESNLFVCTAAGVPVAKMTIGDGRKRKEQQTKPSQKRLRIFK